MSGPDASWAVQSALVTKLQGDAGVAAAFAAVLPTARAVAIFNTLPDGGSPVAYPYVVVMPLTDFDWSAASFTGDEQLFQIHVYDEQPSNKNVDAIARAIAEALDPLKASPLTLTAPHVVVTQRRDSRQSDREGPFAHVLLTYRFRTQEV